MGVTATRVVKFIRKGVGIAYTDVEYADSTSNSVAPTSGWQTTAPAWQNGHYIWLRIKFTYTDGNTAYSRPVCLSGGKGISSITEYYLATSASSGVTTATSGWTTAIQSVTASNKYLWNYEVVTYTDGTTTTTTPVIIGTYGDKGVGITSITEYYLATASSSGVTTSTSGWTTAIQSVTNTKKYLWNYEVVTYTDGTTQTTDPVIIGVYGDKGDTGPEGPQGNDGISYEIACTVGNVAIPADVDSATLNCTAAFYKKVGTAARNAHNCYYAVYSRIGTIYALLSMQSGYSNNGYDDGVAIRGTVYTGYDAVVVFMFTSNYRDNNPAGQAYLAKCEIIVKKQGNTGPQGPQGPQGPSGGTGSQGPRGYRGPGLRGPQDWAQMDTDYQFYKGADGEPYEDFVVYNGNYYKCAKTHTKTLTNYPGSTYDTNKGLWQLSDRLGLVAANILFAPHGYFGSAIISGDWMISTNGTINGTAYNNGATYNGVVAYSLFNPNKPLGGDISKYNYSGTYNFTTSETTKGFDSRTLESGKVYYMEATGKANTSSGSFYIRVRNASTGATYTPVMINGTSSITRSGLFNCTASGTYYIEIYNNGGISGTVTAVKLVERTFAPVYALDLLTGAVYQGNAYIKGTIQTDLCYTKTRTITSASSRSYYINPQTEPADTFFINEPTNSRWVYLPDAVTYDGMEIQVFTKVTNWNTDKMTRIACAVSGQGLYLKVSISTVKDTGNNNIPVQKLTTEFTNFANDSAFMCPNEIHRFKAMNGAWWGLQGNYTGE